MAEWDGFAAGGVADFAHDLGDDGVSASVDLFDLDGDGHYETAVLGTEAGMTVSTDVDGDGVRDKFTAFGRDGHYESWEIFREANGFGQAEMTDSGQL